MRINGRYYRTIGRHGNGVWILDQRLLPAQVAWSELCTLDDAVVAIREMAVRGAGLIGAAAAWGMWLAAQNTPELDAEAFMLAMRQAGERLIATRPTAGNLAFAVRRQLRAMSCEDTIPGRRCAALLEAEAITDEDAAFCRRIGWNGVQIIRQLYEAKLARGAEPVVHVLTHCNAGWLAFVDHGSALAPVYAAVAAGIPVHVWVDETRPRNQGAALTAFELGAHGVPHDLIADNAGGHLMQHDMVDLVIVGADRVTRCGDVANKIGTYLKALAAKDNNVPFYVALPSSSFDFSMMDGVAEIPVEERSQDEVRKVRGVLEDGTEAEVRICPEGTAARNFGFDVTPARLITGLLTERGVCEATEEGIAALYPEGIARAGGANGGPNETTGQDQCSEGVVKFQVEHFIRPLDSALIPLARVLTSVRTCLHDVGLVGMHHGIGYGNVSCRIPSEYGSFLITGTATGEPRVLPLEEFAVVEASFPSENRLLSSGIARPSSESMTHAAVYAVRADVGCVIHVHCRQMFEQLMHSDTPRTPENVAYGTPAMAVAVARLATTLPQEGLFVTPGHPDGVFAFGKDLRSTTERLVELAEALWRNA